MVNLVLRARYRVISTEYRTLMGDPPSLNHHANATPLVRTLLFLQDIDDEVWRRLLLIGCRRGGADCLHIRLVAGRGVGGRSQFKVKGGLPLADHALGSGDAGR